MYNVSYKNHMIMVPCIGFHSPFIIVSQYNIIISMPPHDNLKICWILKQWYSSWGFSDQFVMSQVSRQHDRTTLQWLKRYEGINNPSCAINASQDHKISCVTSWNNKGHGVESFATTHRFYFSIPSTYEISNITPAIWINTLCFNL